MRWESPGNNPTRRDESVLWNILSLLRGIIQGEHLFHTQGNTRCVHLISRGVEMRNRDRRSLLVDIEGKV